MVEELEDGDAKKFFCAVRPSSKIVDNYSFNGDLETIFNMTKETESTWLFRRRFDVAAKRIVCRSEISAIGEFLDFVLKLKKEVMFISVDEETLSVVLSKCKDVSKEKYEELRARISGFTYWSRTLRKVSSSPHLDLEEYNKDTSGLCSAVKVAEILWKAFWEVTKGSKQSLLNIKLLKRPHRHTLKKDGQITIEISSTFRNSPSCIITGEKREQVVIEDSSDESEIEILPDEKNQPGDNEKNKVKFDSRLPSSSQSRTEKKERDRESIEYFEEEEEDEKGKNDIKCEQKPKNNNVITLESEDEGPEVIIVREQENLPCKFVNFKVQKDTEADFQKCHFCGIHGIHSNSLELHYKVSHKAFDWCQLTFPGTPVFKEFSGNFECCICKFAVKNIANHLRRDHNVANVKDFLGLIEQRYSPTLDLSEVGLPPPSSNANVQTRHLLPIYSSDSRPQRTVNNNVEKEKRKNGEEGKKGRKEIECIFCDCSCVQKNISKHYKRQHEGEAWANRAFPGTKVYKYFAELNKYECQICWIRLKCGTDLLTDTGIVEHLREYHKISKKKFRAFPMKIGQMKDGHYVDLQSDVRDNEKCLQKQKKRRKRNAEKVVLSSHQDSNSKRSKLSFNCLICKKCICNANLKTHRWNHWEKLVKNHFEPTTNVKCAICFLLYPETLIGAHILIHHELKQVGCPKCGDMFTDHDVFYNHVTAHINSAKVIPDVQNPSTSSIFSIFKISSGNKANIHK